MRTILIGDVHGCYRELDILLARVRPEPADHVIFVGDLIHRGPDSGKVVRMVKSLSEQRRVTIVEGNHEEKHRRWRRARRTGKENGLRHTHHYPRAEAEMVAAGVDGWLDRPLPYYAKLPEYNAVVLHGGVLPGHEVLPDAELSELSAKEVKQIKKVLRVRYVNPAGKMVKLGDKTTRDEFWPKKYDGRFGRVYFGHQPFARDAQPRDYGDAVSLDLGCVFGGRLVAAVLNGEGAPEYVCAEALATYSDEWTDEAKLDNSTFGVDCLLTN